MKKIHYIIVMLLFVSCSTNQIERKITGCWVIDKVIFEKKTYPKGIGVLLINILCLDANNKCQLPEKLWSNQELLGVWRVVKKKDDFFLRIEDCEESTYNTDYLILFKNENKSQISLVSETIEFHCSRVQM